MADISPLVAVVILNWNGRDDTIECLQSIRGINYPRLMAIVVDNDSSDGSVDAIRSRFPDFPVLETGANLGYAGGNNVGIRHALEQGADYVMILNNDTTVAPNMISVMVEASRLDTKAGILGPKIYYYAEPTRIWSVGAQLNGNGTSLELISPGDAAFLTDEPTVVDAIIGCCMLIRRDVFEKFGFMTEDYFLCWEEFDYCSRIAEGGYHCLYVPEGEMWHKIGSALGEMESPMRAYYNIRNHLLWGKRHLNIGRRISLYWDTAVDVLNTVLPPITAIWANAHPWSVKSLYWALHTYRAEIGRRLGSARTKAKLLAILDFARSRFGPCPDTVRSLLRPPPI